MAKDWGWCIVVLGLSALAYAQNPEKRRTGNVCNVDMDCPDNAFCKLSRYCVCKDGFVYAAINDTHKGCLKEVTFGEPCVQHLQCQSKLGIQAECTSEQVCACRANAHFEADRCFETAVVGQRCMVDQNCFLGDKSDPERVAYCVRGYCSCELAHSPRDAGTRCVKDAALAEPCEDQQQCAGAGLECRGTCNCKEGWVPHNYTRVCLETVKALAEPCDYDVQCSSLSGGRDTPQPGAALCLGSVCVCAYNAREAGNPRHCWYRRRPGESCRQDEECVSEEDEPGYCLNGRCTCKTCSPSPSDFDGAASLSQPLLVPILTAAMFAAAILRF